MADGFQYDVFLSHNQADKPRVRRLAERLRAEVDPLATVGTSAFSLLPSAFHAVLCLSPAALGSDWVGLERSTVVRGNLPFRDPANAGRRFIPLWPDRCRAHRTFRSRGNSIHKAETIS